MKKKIIVSVINDLVTDQRVHKVCESLCELDYEVLLVGRRQRKSLEMDLRKYSTQRMFLVFEKGPLFYFFFQIRLFFLLLFNKAHVLHANDLDTLLPNYLVSKIKGIPLVYDSHEYFTGVPELQNSALKRGLWKSIEQWIFPKLDKVMTVNDSIAGLYQEEYGNEVKVLRNVPQKIQEQNWKSRKELNLPEDKKIIILQGAGINIDRGGEEAVEAMRYVEGALLLIVGGGDVLPVLKKMVQRWSLQEKVVFIPKQPYQQLIHYTHAADIGLTLDKDTNINYRYSLPNKLFDYIHAGIAVLASPLVEVKKIVEQYQVGLCIDQYDPKHIAGKLKSMLEGEELNKWKENTNIAAEQLCWENEEQVLKAIYAG